MDEFLFKLQHLLRSVKSAFIVSRFFSTSLLTACFEKRTTNPLKAYRYWFDEDPGKDVRLPHARYWQSAHWSKEYELYLQFSASPAWRSAFTTQHHFHIDTVFSLPTDKPAWFVPGQHDKIWKPAGNFSSSFLLEDTVTGRLLLYDLQL